MGSQGGGWSAGQSKEFMDLVKSIGETRSKAEEDRIVIHEIETLKRRLAEPDIPKRKLKEYIIRLVYVEMLGHDASFGYIHAVKMTHDDSLLLKRTGYLAVTLFLSEDHDLIILIVNTIQKDLKSDNYLVVCAALNVVCKLINEETIPALLPQVVELLGHPKDAVRKKAIMALHRFYQRSPSSVAHLISSFRKRLCDNDPGVMGATLCPLFELITIDVNSYKELVISFVSILKQVVEHRLPKSYDYHQMPAPFIQIKLLKILALLGCGDKQASENMYTVVGEIFRKCDSLSNIGNAVLYECICCVSSIYPSTKLLESAAEAISKFLKSESHNLKYMGIDALSRLIRSSPEFAEQQQLAVIDCLEDPDDSLKRKTFELLYKMTKSSNVEVIADRMIDYMISINDHHYKTEIASQCVELAEQFAPSNNWFIQTMNKVFEHAGDLVSIKLAHNLMRLIADGFGEEDDNTDSQLRSSAVESYLHIIGEPKLPSVFLQIICWVLGEYGTADGRYSASYIAGKLCDVAEAHANDDTVKAYAVSALMKMYSFEIASGKKIDILPECQSFIEDLCASHSTDLQQRAYELQSVICLDAHAVKVIMPLDASCKDVEIDKSLAFLDGHVQQAIKKGARPYIPDGERSGTLDINISSQFHHESSGHALKFEAYDLPKTSAPLTLPPIAHSSASELVPVPVPVPEPSSLREINESALVPTISSTAEPELRLRLDGVQPKWGRPSYSSPSLSTINRTPEKTVNGVTQLDGRGGAANSKSHEDLSKPRDEVSSEKQKLAASLFGGSTKAEKKPQKVAKAAGKPQQEKAAVQPPPDLLDLSEPNECGADSSVDPFKQLEGLLEQTDMAMASPATASEAQGSMPGVQKGADLKDSLEKDAIVRQMGVKPSGQNPNLFKDLLS